MPTRFLRCCTILLSGCLVGMLAGCGPVDYSTMSPKVWKPSAEIFLVDSPLGWQTDAVRQLSENAGVWGEVQSVDDAHLQAAVNRALKVTQVELVVIVRAGPITSQDVAMAASHMATRFEFVGASGVPVSAVNVRQVVPDGGVAGFQLGWLAGQLAAIQGRNQLAWLRDGTFRLPPASVKVALGGVFRANPKTSLSVVVPSVIGQTGAAVPHVLITDMSLNAAQYSWLQQQGILLVSLLPGTAPAEAAAEPSVPGASALGADLTSFAKMGWQSGTIGVADPPVVVVHSSAIPVNLLSAVPAVAQPNGAVITNAWNQIPAAIRLTWSSVLGLQG